MIMILSLFLMFLPVYAAQMNSVGLSGLLVVLMSLTQQSVTETSAASLVVSPGGVCVSEGEIFQLKWTAKNARPGESLEVCCRRQDGSRIALELDTTKCDIQNSTRQCCDNQTQRCVLETKLTVHNTGPEDSGFCDCRVKGEAADPCDASATSKDSRANVWFRNDSVFSLSQDDITVTPGQDQLTVSFNISCDLDGSVEVFHEGKDSSTPLEHIWNGRAAGQRQTPYLRLGVGPPDLIFPAPDCRDEGMYLVIYRASRSFKPVETTRYLRIRVSGASCPEGIHRILTTTPHSEGVPDPVGMQSSSETPTYKPCPAECSDNMAYKVALGVCTVCLLFAIGVCVYQWLRIRHLMQGQIRVPNDRNEQFTMKPLQQND